MSRKKLTGKELIEKEQKQAKENRILSIAGFVIIVLALLTIGLLNTDTLFGGKIDNPFQQKLSMNIGETLEFNKVYKNKQKMEVEYFSSDETIAMIDRDTGVLYAKNNGTVVISVRSKEDGSVLIEYTVVVKKPTAELGWIMFEQDEFACNEGETFDTMIRTNGSAIKEFKSSNYTIATIENGTESGLVTNCVDCRAVHVTCKKEGRAVLSASSSSGAIATAKVVVSAPAKGWIKFDQDSYACSEGDVFDAMITAGGATSPVAVASFKSSNTNIATIEAGTTTGDVTNCVDCKAVHVTCKKSGNVVLSATSSTGVVASSTVTVGAPDKGWIRYDQATFTCKKGQVIDTMITTGGASKPATIKSFSSNNTAVAVVESGTSTGAVTNCYNCKAVHITCKEEGVATLSATSSTGASTTSRVTVNPLEKGWVRFNQDSYTCRKGQVFDAMITAGGADMPASITSFSSSNSNIATIENGTSNGMVTNCIDCRAVHVTCKNEGTVTLRATSSTGATVSVNVTVTAPDPGWIMFKETSYQCHKGDVIDTMINTGTNSGGMVPTVQSFTSKNPSIATIEEGTSSGAVTNCYNCRAVHITCKAEGEAILTATSSTGVVASASVSVSAPAVGTISYSQTSYTCKVGDVVDTMITAKNTPPASVASFASTNTNVVTIESGTSTGMVTNCFNCRAVHFTCKKAGTANLTATSSSGATVSVPVTVKR